MHWTGCTQTNQPHKVFPGWTLATADIAVWVPASVWTSWPCNQPTGPPLRVSNQRELESWSSMPTSGTRGESMKMVNNVTEAPVDQNANCMRSMAADLYILHICYCPKKVNLNQTLTESWESSGHCQHVLSTSARHLVQPGEYFPGLHQLPLIVSHLQMNWTKGIWGYPAFLWAVEHCSPDGTMTPHRLAMWAKRVKMALSAIYTCTYSKEVQCFPNHPLPCNLACKGVIVF